MLQNFFCPQLTKFPNEYSVCPWQAFRAYFNKHSSLVRTPDFIQQVPPLSSVQAKWVQSIKKVWNGFIIFRQYSTESVQLTSLYWQVQISCFLHKNCIFFFFYKQPILMRRSTVLNLPLSASFPWFRGCRKGKIQRLSLCVGASASALPWLPPLALLWLPDLALL